MPPGDSPRTARDADRLVFGGLLGLAVAGVLQLLDKKPEGSLPLNIALYAFAGSIPLLAASLVTELVRARQPNPRPLAGWRALLGLLAAVAAVVGLAAVFFHSGPGPGAVFLLSVCAAAAVVRSL